MHATPTRDIKLAAILTALGIPMRPEDPITCVEEERKGKMIKQFTFWFDTTLPENQRKVAIFINAYDKARDWKEYTLDKEHPIYWMKGALENRERFLGWIREDVQPMKLIQSGSRTVLIGANASPELKKQIKQHL